jgi:hypothetical protein
MLTDEEAQAAYARLVQILREANFGHVVAQVAEEIRLGRLESKTVQISEVSAVEQMRIEPGKKAKVKTKPKGKTETFTHAVEFNSHEKLELLLRAIERATIEVAQMHEATADIISETRTRASEADVQNKPETFIFRDNLTEQKLVSDPDMREKLVTSCTALTPLLDEIRKDINAPQR